MKLRHCRRCNTSKPDTLEHFYDDPSNCWCRVCKRQYNHDWHAAKHSNPDFEIERQPAPPVRVAVTTSPADAEPRSARLLADAAAFVDRFPHAHNALWAITCHWGLR